jgi:hypothetical protein
MFDLKGPSLVQQITKSVVSVDASTWNEFDVCHFIEESYHKHVDENFKVPPRHVKWQSMAETFLEMCMRERIDPEVWIHAQTCLLSKFLKGGGKLYPSMLLGKNAILRYEKYREHNKRHFRNTKERHDISLQTIIEGETLYGSVAVRTIFSQGRKAWNKDFRIKLKEAVHNSHSGWDYKNPKRIDARPHALLNVLGSLNHELTVSVRLKRDFKWSEIATFIVEQNNA